MSIELIILGGIASSVAAAMIYSWFDEEDGSYGIPRIPPTLPPPTRGHGIRKDKAPNIPQPPPPKPPSRRIKQP